VTKIRICDIYKGFQFPFFPVSAFYISVNLLGGSWDLD
jgi:hypothetical protein